MFKTMKNITASILVSSFLFMPCFAAQNYTYTTKVQDNYTVAPQEGTVVNNNYYESYNTVPAVTVGYTNTPIPVSYTNTPVPVYQNGVQTGYYNGYAQNAATYYPVATTNPSQSYSHDYTVTQSYEDTRENVDKNISRAGNIALIVGGLALVGAVATSIFKD